MGGALASIRVACAALAIAALTFGVINRSTSGASAVPAGPTPKYDCTFNQTTLAWTGAFGSASTIGWEGSGTSPITCLGGVFYLQDYRNQNYGFGIYNGGQLTWQNADGYLPAQITSFHRTGTTVSITEFADKVQVGGKTYVAVYSRVSIDNPTKHTVTADPDPSSGLVPLNQAPTAVAPHSTVDHDYVVAADRFGNSYTWPATTTLAAAGGYAQHFAHMKQFWNKQLSEIAQIGVPNTALNNAYRSGFIYTQIARSGDHLNTGVNGYETEFSHDVVGILTNLLLQGYDTGVQTLLTAVRDDVVTQQATQAYQDGAWLYPLPWAIYLLKTGDLQAVEQNFTTDGPLGASQPSIQTAAHDIAAARTGPGGIIEATNDIDTVGYWTEDDYEALTGLAAYRYLATRIGDATEATWASQQYDVLLAATNKTLESTIDRYHLTYLPCSLVEPNTANRCKNPEDANWTSPLANWAWDASLLGSPVNGPGASMIDATYAYGFGRLHGKLPPNTTGGFPGDYFSSAYNAVMGTDGLSSAHHRDQGILDYEFMIDHTQSGPDSWWESSSAPSKSTPWVGFHPASGQGASPHAWGMAGANNVLLSSLAAVRTDGTLLVGQGVPDAWLRGRVPLTVTHFPAADGDRVDLTITPKGSSVTLTLHGSVPRHVDFDLPSFINNVASTSSGRTDEATGTVALAPGATSVTVHFRAAP
jgi:hypothetical protein